MIPHYLDPKNDFIFKKIFGHHAELLKSFLNAILPLPEDCIIESLTYIPPESVPVIEGFKYTVVDVRCYDNHGRHFIVEMQIQWTKHFIQRMLFNTAATYTHQLKKGQDYDHLSPVYGLALINATFTKEEEWFHHFQMTDKKNRTLDDIQLVLIELPKFKPTNISLKKLAVLWLRFFKEINEQTKTVDQSLLAEEPIKKALDLLEASSYTEAELRAYDKVWDAISTGKTLMNDKMREAEAKGLAKGRAEGKAEGRVEGQAEGEARANTKFVINMHNAGMPMDQICQFSGFSQEQVRQMILNNPSVQ